jgi:hypothetical protein
MKVRASLYPQVARLIPEVGVSGTRCAVLVVVVVFEKRFVSFVSEPIESGRRTKPELAKRSYYNLSPSARLITQRLQGAPATKPW